MKQPDFIIGGSTRSGLRALTYALDHHAQIFIPQRKEHQFFHQEKILQNGTGTCLTPFEDAVYVENKNRIPQDRVIRGEHEYNPKRAYEGCPHAKIIFTLRNPVERAYIQYAQALTERKENAKSFEKAIEAELSGLRSPDTTGRCWIYKNQYQKHLEEWLRYYPRSKILIMIYEEWTNPSSDSLAELEKFLGLKESSIRDKAKDGLRAFADFSDIHEKKLKKIPPLSDATKEQLEDILSIDKTFIENFLGREIETWAQSN